MEFPGRADINSIAPPIQRNKIRLSKTHPLSSQITPNMNDCDYWMMSSKSQLMNGRFQSAADHQKSMADKQRGPSFIVWLGGLHYGFTEHRMMVGLLDRLPRKKTVQKPVFTKQSYYLTLM